MSPGDDVHPREILLGHECVDIGIAHRGKRWRGSGILQLWSVQPEFHRVASMRVEAARPDVASLVFRLFCRTVHPELLDVYSQESFVQESYSVQLQICDAGHLVSFRHGGQTLCEVATSL